MDVRASAPSGGAAGGGFSGGSGSGGGFAGGGGGGGFDDAGPPAAGSSPFAAPSQQSSAPQRDAAPSAPASNPFAAEPRQESDPVAASTPSAAPTNPFALDQAAEPAPPPFGGPPPQAPTQRASPPPEPSARAPGGAGAAFEPRAIDGAGNNPFFEDVGQAGTPLARVLAPDYGDGSAAPAGAERPSPRAISNAVVDQGELSSNQFGLSNLFWQTGQFIDHDLTSVPVDDDRQLPISVPSGDPSFDPSGAGDASLAFGRSEGERDFFGVNQQTNELTHFIDGSQIYGSDDARAARLRSFEGGQLRLTEEGLLPGDDDEGFLAGDARVAEQPGLSALHTVFAREHNRVAERLQQENPDLSDEELYQAARRETTAVLQSITYNEFVPALLGENALPAYRGYDPFTDPSVSNAFATSAFRFGHSMVTPDLARLDENGAALEGGPLSLRDSFEDPSHLRKDGVEPYLRGLASTGAQELDNRIADDLRNLLFGPPGSDGRDLAALNIQRGRDHGLPGYNDAREQLGLRRLTGFDDPALRDGVGDRLASVYDSIDDVDLWVGGLAERPSAQGGVVGDTNRAILADQFARSRDGDRFFYKNQFSGADLARIENTTLSDVIERNSGIDELQDQSLYLPGRGANA